MRPFPSGPAGQRRLKKREGLATADHQAGRGRRNLRRPGANAGPCGRAGRSGCVAENHPSVAAAWASADYGVGRHDRPDNGWGTHRADRYWVDSWELTSHS